MDNSKDISQRKMAHAQLVCVLELSVLLAFCCFQGPQRGGALSNDIVRLVAGARRVRLLLCNRETVCPASFLLALHATLIGFSRSIEARLRHAAVACPEILVNQRVVASGSRLDVFVKRLRC